MRVGINKRAIKKPHFPKTKASKTSPKEIKILNLAIHLEKLTAQLNNNMRHLTTK